MNIAEILKYCPKGTELYSTVFGEVELFGVNNDLIYINTPYITFLFSDGKYKEKGECILFPSKDQRDWNKFRLPVKKGDIMMTTDKRAFIATGKVDSGGCPSAYCGIDTYHNFTIGTTTNGWTALSYIPVSEEVKKELFDKMAEAGYKWNANTLELEKMESEFKEGNVIKDNKNNLYLIVDTNVRPKIGCALNQDMKLTILDKVTTLASIKFTLANEEERNILYSALVREGYQYDKKQHKLVKQEFKPFDKVLVRDDTTEKWSIGQFSYYDEENEDFPYICMNGCYHYCIPYEGNEYLLGTTDSPI